MGLQRIMLKSGLLFLTIILVSSERTKDKMYDTVDGAAACFRRLNGTHQFGCTSGRSGNVGVIHIIENSTDLEWLLHNGSADPYMAVLQPHMFNREVMISLKDSGKVSGVLLINSSDKHPDAFSHDDQCPNRYSGLSSFSSPKCSADTPWNPIGSNMMMVDWGFPIFFVNTTESVTKIYDCFQKHNAEDKDRNPTRSLCALEMNAYMFAAVDSHTCIRRSNITNNFNPIRYCDPLGDRNVWSTLFPRKKDMAEEANRTVIVVSAWLDGTSMFDGVVPGAVTPTAGIVTLLSVAKHLAKMLPFEDSSKNYTKNVLFTLLNGESYDYIGSSRLVWDMQHQAFPVRPDDTVKDQPPPLQLQHVGLFVELSQLLSAFAMNKSSTLFLHSLQSTNSNTGMLTEFMGQLSEVGKRYDMEFSSSQMGNQLPPASLQSFLAADSNIEGVVLADHAGQFANRYYHSIYDDNSFIKYTYMNKSEPAVDSVQSFVANLSVILAESLYYLITKEKYTGTQLQPDLQNVDELFHCYLDTTDCSLFRAVSQKTKLSSRPSSLYVGVTVWPSELTTLTGQVLALLTGKTVDMTEEECHSDPLHQVFQYFWVSNGSSNGSLETGTCIETTMNFSSAVSPVFFEIADYDWTSGKYPTWTESIWREFSVRMFLKPSASHENLTFALGVVVMLLSFFIVYFTHSRSHILFATMLSSNGC